MELKKCPFCGEKAGIEHVSNGGMPSGSYVRCSGCGCKTKTILVSASYSFDEKATELWNRRAGDGEV